MLFAKVLSLVLLASLSSAYTIQSGDTYCLIAQKYGCSDWTALQKANGYGVYTLPVGGYMNIPSSCTGYQTCYNAQVQPGDTYSSIASRYNVDATCLSNTNCNGGLYAYGTICIPTNCQNSGSVTQAPSQSGYGNYVIQSGDTYCQIAQKYGCSDWTVLQKYNQYPVYALPVGGSMTIPSTCSGTKTCKDAQVQPGDSYYTIASRYNVDVTCLATTNCNNVNDVLNAYGTICIPTNCANSGATTQAPTTTATATPVQNGFANGLFYCNGYQMSVVYPPTVQNCGGVYYTNGAPANGYVGSTFYCNGVATSSTTGTCGGLYYNNGNVYTGVIGSTFYCSGVDTGSPKNSLMNCGGVNYYAGSPANGWINGQFYCNGVQSTATASNQQICGGQYYSNGSPSSGYYNGQFYCNGVATSTTTGLCSGTYYSNGAALYSCSTALYFANSESCSTFISDNPNYTEQQLINCNPSLNLSSSNCVLPQGTIMV